MPIMDELEKWSRRRPNWMREFFAEFFGTFFIVCIGDAAIANYLLNKDNKIGVDHFAVCFAFGVGVLIGVSIAINISGAHLNPAVTIAVATLGEFPAKKIPLYLLAQYLGAFMAAFSVFCAYYEGITAYDGGLRTPYKFNVNATGMTGGIFSTYPAPHISLTGSVVDQILATFLLMFAVMAITDKNGVNTPKHLVPTVLAFVITGICIAFGLNCGAVLNPARDLGPRFFQLLAGYGITAFKPVQSLYWLTAGVIGPHLGGILGAWVYKLAITQTPEDSPKSIVMTDIYATDNKQNNQSVHKSLMDELEKSRPLMSGQNTEATIEVLDHKNI